MARNINQRLNSLKARRSGSDRLDGLTYDQMTKAFEAAAATDIYEKRSGQKHSQYALGAMQEVGSDYTRVSVTTAERIGNQLESGLEGFSINVEFRLQGSVPANIHIRGYSDVDLLVLRLGFLTYATAGAQALRGGYTSPSPPRTSTEVLQELRTASTKILKAQFPAADVDTGGGKAVKISGGSLARTVDVVPSHWFDTLAYQSSWREVDRGVTIYDRKIAWTLDNYPFKHIELLGQRDTATSGGLKKAIRLCKNVKCDADSDIGLSSFEIASLLYYADQQELRRGVAYELAILAEAQRYLDYLHNNTSVASALRVPDGSRLILDSEKKRAALTSLSIELDTLARDVSKEQSLAMMLYPDAGFDEVGRVLREAYIPVA